MIKNTIKFLLLVLVFGLTFLTAPVRAQENLANDFNKEIDLYFFWAEGCSHCSDEKVFLAKMEQKYSGLEVHSFEVSRNKENIELLKKVSNELSVEVSGVPFTVIDNQYFAGWYNEQTTGVEIENAIKYSNTKKMPEKINLPIVGQIEIKNISLPILTILIAGIDGFNPCAMWVLIFLITLLVGMEDKKRMWIIGITFIFSSAFVYFLFLSAWLNLFLFLGFVLWVRITIGLVALAAGGYNLREYFLNKSGECKVTNSKKRQKIFEKLKNLTQRKQLYIALVGTVILAFSVNLVELICSAGLPAIFTQILVLSSLAKWQYYAYLVLYVFVFMLDDLIVFFIAMKTLQITGISTKYSHVSHLVGGIIMLIMGILLLFKPELLVFG